MKEMIIWEGQDYFAEKARARYDFNGNNRGMDLKAGDSIEIYAGKQVINCKILWTKKENGKIMYGTDNLGIVYANELIRL